MVIVTLEQCNILELITFWFQCFFFISNAYFLLKWKQVYSLQKFSNWLIDLQRWVADVLIQTCFNKGTCTTVNGAAKCDCTNSDPPSKGEFCQSRKFQLKQLQSSLDIYYQNSSSNQHQTAFDCGLLAHLHCRRRPQIPVLYKNGSRDPN